MQKNIFKRTAVAIALTTTIFSGVASAALVGFESDYTNQIHGIQPIIPTIGAVIFKKNASVPYAAADNNDTKTQPQVGDTLYVPVSVLEQVKTQYPNAYPADIYGFADYDTDPEDAAEMAVKVEWYVLDDADTSFEGKTPVQTQNIANTYGVPYVVRPGDVGKKIGFRITPQTKYGLPLIGQPLDVTDISKLAGQSYPDTDGDGFPDVDENGNPKPPVVDEEKGKEENPNIGDGTVKIGNDLYLVQIVNEKGQVMDGKSTDFVPYVNTQYSAKVFKVDGDKYIDVTENDEIKNNLVWKLYTVTKEGNVGHVPVVNTGLSATAAGETAELDALRADVSFQQKIVEGSAITGRIGADTTTFTTQKTNADALYKGAPNYSEQGLQLKVVLVADDGN